MRLFEAALPIFDIDPKSLSPQGVVYKASIDEDAEHDAQSCEGRRVCARWWPAEHHPRGELGAFLGPFNWETKLTPDSGGREHLHYAGGSSAPLRQGWCAHREG